MNRKVERIDPKSIAFLAILIVMIVIAPLSVPLGFKSTLNFGDICIVVILSYSAASSAVNLVELVYRILRKFKESLAIQLMGVLLLLIFSIYGYIDFFINK